MPVKPRIKFSPGKTYVYSGTEGVYSVIAGELLEGDGVSAGGSGVSYGNGAPSAGNGKNGDVYLDLTNFKIHTKSSGAWDGGTVFKGSNGSNGANGKSIRFGNGAPLSGLGDNDDVYLDLNDFKVHTKSAGSWSGGTAFKGSNGSNGSNGINGKSIKFGNGAPSGAPGEDDDLYFDLDNFHVYPKSAGAWNAAGKKLFKGDAGTNGVKGTSLLQGSGSPLAGAGDDGDTFLDVTNHTVYKKSGGAWSAQGSSFKGTKGDDGKRGKTTLEGSGPPGTSTNLATPTAALTAALTAESMTAADLEAGDLYLDTTNHMFYRKTALGWTARTAFKGADGINAATILQGSSAPSGAAGAVGDTFIDTTNHAIYKKTGASTWTSQGSSFKGDTGAKGEGYDFYIDALSADKLLAHNSLVTLKFADNERDTSSLVAESGTTTSTYTVAAGKAGRYRIEFNLALKTVIADIPASYECDAYIYVNNVERASASVSVNATAAVSYPVTRYKNLYCTAVVYLQEGATIQCKAKRITADANVTLYANKLDKATESGEDTSITITKL